MKRRRFPHLRHSPQLTAPCGERTTQRWIHVETTERAVFVTMGFIPVPQTRAERWRLMRRSRGSKKGRYRIANLHAVLSNLHARAIPVNHLRTAFTARLRVSRAGRKARPYGARAHNAVHLHGPRRGRCIDPRSRAADRSRPRQRAQRRAAPIRQRRRNTRIRGRPGEYASPTLGN